MFAALSASVAGGSNSTTRAVPVMQAIESDTTGSVSNPAATQSSRHSDGNEVSPAPARTTRVQRVAALKVRSLAPELHFNSMALDSDEVATSNNPSKQAMRPMP